MDIKALREQYHLTQNGLAEKLGVSWRTVQNWEMGSQIPKTRMKRIEQLFGEGAAYVAEPQVEYKKTELKSDTTLQLIQNELSSLRKMMQEDCAAKNAIIKELVALLKQ